MCSQCLHNSGIRENLGKANHIEEVAAREAATELRGQLSPQCGDNLGAIFGPLFLEDVLSDALRHDAVMPVNGCCRRLRKAVLWVPPAGCATQKWSVFRFSREMAGL